MCDKIFFNHLSSIVVNKLTKFSIKANLSGFVQDPNCLVVKYSYPMKFIVLGKISPDIFCRYF